MNKQRGGWLVNAMNPNDRRGLKAQNIHDILRKFKLSYELGENGNDFDNRTLTSVGKLITEAEQPLPLTQQWFFFTPDEVEKTNKEIENDCVNTDRKDFNEYLDDLRSLVTYFSDRPTVARKMMNLIHDLCPANTQVATAIPVAVGHEATRDDLPVAEAVVEGGRRKSQRRKRGSKFSRKLSRKLSRRKRR